MSSVCLEAHVIVVVKLLIHVQLYATLWTVAYQPPLSMGFPRQEYSSGLPFPSLGNLPNSGIEPASPAWQVGSSPLRDLGSLLRPIPLFKNL